MINLCFDLNTTILWLSLTHLYCMCLRLNQLVLSSRLFGTLATPYQLIRYYHLKYGSDKLILQ